MHFFNVRVYGLLMHEGSILTVEEPVWGEQVLKFPGGGLEFGEGLLDCLKREFREELNCQLTDIRHFYTTDFFVESAFQPGVQLISVYYRVWVHKPHEIAAIDSSDKAVISEGEQAFLWVSPQRENAVELTFPVDRIVWNMLA